VSHEVTALTITAASIGLFHTLLGPDHYLPFIMMAKAGRWSMIKMTWVTCLCGVGHIAGSILLGIVGIALGIGITKLEVVESFRGSLAAWALVAFGLVYFVWGLRKALRNRHHRHWHTHGDETIHIHRHVHAKEHLHIHKRESAADLTPCYYLQSLPWALVSH
jgi:hypothetical protein